MVSFLITAQSKVSDILFITMEVFLRGVSIFLIFLHHQTIFLPLKLYSDLTVNSLIITTKSNRMHFNLFNCCIDRGIARVKDSLNSNI